MLCHDLPGPIAKTEAKAARGRENREIGKPRFDYFINCLILTFATSVFKKEGTKTENYIVSRENVGVMSARRAPLAALLPDRLTPALSTEQAGRGKKPEDIWL